MPFQLSRQSAGLLSLWSWVRTPRRAPYQVTQAVNGAALKMLCENFVGSNPTPGTIVFTDSKCNLLLPQLSWLERATVNRKVIGSIPIGSATLANLNAIKLCFTAILKLRRLKIYMSQDFVGSNPTIYQHVNVSKWSKE